VIHTKQQRCCSPQVLLVALEPGSPFPKPVSPASGSHSCLGQAVGAQRLPDGGMLRVVATDRVMAQVGSVCTHHGLHARTCLAAFTKQPVTWG
jgi:hypothetical protein